MRITTEKNTTALATQAFLPHTVEPVSGDLDLGNDRADAVSFRLIDNLIQNYHFIPMRNSGKAPTMAVWIISLVLFLVAIAAHFRVVKIGDPIATWSWIVGYVLLLIACRVRGL